MPAYDYKCQKCGYIFEVQQRITEEPLKHCPKCKGKIVRLISPAGIIFKGSGFHMTDYKKQKTEKKAATAKKQEKPHKSQSEPNKGGKESKQTK
jgi:putative FmdB family regulatory protein